MKILFPLLVSALLLPGFPVLAQDSDSGILKVGVMVGTVVDPYSSGIEQVHAAAAGVLRYQKRLAASIRPMLLFNSRSLFFRVPVFLEIPLFGQRPGVSRNQSPLSISLVGGGGVGTWEGQTGCELEPLLSGGVELSFCSLLASGLITAVVRAGDLDLLTDLFVGYLWEL